MNHFIHNEGYFITIYDITIASKENRIDILEYFVEHLEFINDNISINDYYLFRNYINIDFDINTENDNIWKIISRDGHLKILKLLVEKYDKDDKKVYLNMSFLSALKAGHLNIVKYIWDMNEMNIELYVVLKISINYGRVSIIDYFMKKYIGKITNETNDIRNSAHIRNSVIHDFKQAVIHCHSHFKVVEYFININLDIDWGQMFINLCKTGYHDIIQTGYHDIIRLFLSKKKISNTTKTDALIVICRRYNEQYDNNQYSNIYRYRQRQNEQNQGYKDIIEFLLQNGADINTVFINISKNQHYNMSNILKLLLEFGANVHIKNDAPIRWAIYNSNIKATEFLIQNGSNPHINDEYVLRCASANGYTSIVKILVEKKADYKVL